LRDKIQTYYTSTPLSYRDYINTPDGSAYGVLRDSTNPLKAYISPRTKVNNLYLTGQNLNMHGVLGVTVGAIITCSQLIDGSQLIEDIRKA
jgi:all-trans-retinol 13,14-reductase